MDLSKLSVKIKSFEVYLYPEEGTVFSSGEILRDSIIKEMRDSCMTEEDTKEVERIIHNMKMEVYILNGGKEAKCYSSFINPIDFKDLP